MLDHNTIKEIEDTREKYPFLSFLVSNDTVRVGIVQNASPKIIHFYDIEKIEDESDRKNILDHADTWWWESNQTVPVNMFVGEEFKQFEPVLIGIPRKSVADIIGPCFSLHEKYLKRLKKKKVQILNIK